MRAFSPSARIATKVALIGLTVLALGVAALWSLRTVIEGGSRIISLYTHEMAQIDDMRLALEQTDAGVRGFQVSRREKLLQDAYSALNRIPALLEQLRRHAELPGESHHFRELESALNRYRATLPEVIRLSRELPASRDRLLALVDKELAPSRGEMITALSELHRIHQHYLGQRIDQMNALALWSTLIVFGLIVVSIFLIAMVTRVIYRALLARDGVESALRRERDFNDALFESSGALVVVLDRDGRIVRFNRTSELVSGYKFDDVRGKCPWDFLIPKDQVETFRQAFDQIVSGDFPKKHENDWITRYGERRNISWSNTALAEDRVTFVLATGLDVTEKIQVEKERARLVERLEEAVRMRDEFISIASHELRTPLTSLRLQIQMTLRLFQKAKLATGAVPEEIAGSVETSFRQVQRLTKLVEDMLDISRISAGKLPLHPEHFDLAALVTEVCDRNSQQLAAARCELERRIEGPIEGEWDKSRVDQVFVNFLSNAIKYGAGKPVIVSARTTEGFAEVSVTDHGIGIAEEDQTRIFERYERAVPAASISGLGLGLYISKNIVDAHRGQIKVKSKVGEGTTITVRLPMHL